MSFNLILRNEKENLIKDTGESLNNILEKVISIKVDEVWEFSDWFKKGKLFDFKPEWKSNIFDLDIKADMWKLSEKEIKDMNKWFKDNKENYIKLYHWTSPEHKILEQGLKATWKKTARSLQSWHWYTYLSYDPARAKMFWEIGYAWKTPKVYEVIVKIKDLKPDIDQLWNKRMWGENPNIWETLADSLFYWKGFRVKWWIEPWKITEFKEDNT